MLTTIRATLARWRAAPPTTLPETEAMGITDTETTTENMPAEAPAPMSFEGPPMRLRRGAESFPMDDWHFLPALALAAACGWAPAGTTAPQAGRIAAGTYAYAFGQEIGDGDARAFAAALRRALERMPRDRRADVYAEVVSMLDLRLCQFGGMEKSIPLTMLFGRPFLAATCTVHKEVFVRALAAFLEGGACTIEP